MLRRRETDADSWKNLLLLQPGQTLTASIPPINDFMAASACLHPPGLPGKTQLGGYGSSDRGVSGFFKASCVRV